MISFTEQVCKNLDEAASREWLETNGIGGFASSTIAGMNTRRYHGLLVAATHPPVGRMVLVSKLEETLIIDGTAFDLGTNAYVGAIHPSGYQQLVNFRLDPWPIFTYEVNGVTLEKSLSMVYGSNTTLISYRLLSPSNDRSIRLQLRPLIAFRDYHSTTHENNAINGTHENTDRELTFRPYDDVPPCFLAHNAVSVSPQGFWYRNFLYSVEQERGLDYIEDLFNPTVLEFDLTGTAAKVIVSTETHAIDGFESLQSSEASRRRDLALASPLADDFGRQLVVAADQFIVRRGNGHTIIAGYPWFTDWGRDTMISLPGLAISTGCADIAKTVLRTFSEHADQGMLPNLFRDDGTSAFNTVDATLWFFEAVRAYADATSDYDFVRELYPVLNDIIDWHIRGTRYDIHVLDNGLLNAGVPGVQLTWMDAKVGVTVITPRIGKPVEIQALWYNALCIISSFASRFDDLVRQRRYDDLSSRLRRSFNRLFWNESAGCLYDVVNGGPPDASIRPNQVFAISLTHSMVSKERARSILNVIDTHLLTEYGLRTLAPSDPAYRGRYEGNAAIRDSAYHQGTVWPWLLGPYVSAYLRVHDHSLEARRHASELLQPLALHLSQAGLGQISEIFDGSSPQRPRGCFAQAWSVAELIRAKVAIGAIAEEQAAAAS